MIKFIVIGASGFVGRKVLSHLENLNISSTGTARSQDLFSNLINFEIGKDEINPLVENVTHAIVPASVSNYFECETNPQAYETNVELIPELIAQLLQKHIKVNYISSNTVFGGNISWPLENETTKKDLDFEYARQKQRAERKIIESAIRLKQEDNLSITRLTKVISRIVSPFEEWHKLFSNNRPVSPFTNLIFAPITLKYAAENIVKISENSGGIYHLSGSENISYEEFCYLFAESFQFNKDLIHPTTSIIENVRIPFLPTFSGLGMKSTRDNLGIYPQNKQEVIDYLKGEFNEFNQKS